MRTYFAFSCGGEMTYSLGCVWLAFLCIIIVLAIGIKGRTHCLFSLIVNLPERDVSVSLQRFSILFLIALILTLITIYLLG